MQLTRLQIDVAREDIVQNQVLDEIIAVILLVIILLDDNERAGENGGVLRSLVVCTLDKNRRLGSGVRTEGTVAVAVVDKALALTDLLYGDVGGGLADLAEIAAGKDGAGRLDNAYGSVDGISHLMNDCLI